MRVYNYNKHFKVPEFCFMKKNAKITSVKVAGFSDYQQSSSIVCPKEDVSDVMKLVKVKMSSRKSNGIPAGYVLH